ncbi:MAG: hypothetical protein ABI539_07620, partial [Acidobacteriota bacterium]
QFAHSAELDRWRQIIRQLTLKPSPGPGKSPPVIRLKCRSCGTGMRVPSSVLEGKSQMGVRCPDPKCGKMTYLKKKPSPAEPPEPTKKEMEKNLSYDE